MARDWDDWDKICHEYGHKVAQAYGVFDWEVTLDWAHSPGRNARHRYPSQTPKHLLHLGWNEGFANFYSVLAQNEQGVSTPAVPPAGNTAFGTWDIETNTPSGRGEDEEVSVMRILWDLYDSTNEPGDNVALGYPALISLIKDNSVTTLDKLWDTLVAQAAGNNSQIIDYAAIFELHNVSPQAFQLQDPSGNPVPVWNAGDPVPTFVWEITQGSGAVGNVLDHLGIKVFDAAHNEIWDSATAADPYLTQAVLPPKPSDVLSRW